MLTAIKLSHTIIWAVLGGMIVALPVVAVLRRFRWAAIISVIILVECAVLGLNGGRCPLTDMAAHFTADRAPNFDIYLPLWLAEHNKTVFGSIFIVGEFVLLASWARQRRNAPLP